MNLANKLTWVASKAYGVAHDLSRFFLKVEHFGSTRCRVQGCWNRSVDPLSGNSHLWACDRCLTKHGEWVVDLYTKE